MTTIYDVVRAWSFGAEGFQPASNMGAERKLV
jgi:hypothetical protein